MGKIKCPNCLREVSEENNFCIFCGVDLKTVKDAGYEPVDGGEPDMPKARYCANGHRIDDLELKFCTVCGLPLEPIKGVGDSGPFERKWKCYCGAENNIETLTCKECGKPKGWSPDPAPDRMMDIPMPPSGMRSPTAEDLLPKKKGEME